MYIIDNSKHYRKVRNEKTEAFFPAESAGDTPLPPLVVAEVGEDRAGGAYHLVRGRPGSDFRLCLAGHVSLAPTKSVQKAGH